jgi:hypothetical protein
MTPEAEVYFAILSEELLKVPGKVSARVAEQTNPAMCAAILKQAFSQALRRVAIRYRQEGKKAR